MSDSTWDILNKHIAFFKTGDLVVVEKAILKKHYNVNAEDRFNIGLLVCDAANLMKGWDTPKFNKNIYCNKMYKILILNRIIIIDHKDIKEKIL